jgi:phosphoglucomutase/phosphomannomutase
MLMCELAAELKARGQSMHDFLCDLYRQHGYHRETLINLVMEGSEGMAAIQRLMTAFRQSPPKSLAGIDVVGLRDYGAATKLDTRSGRSQPLTGPHGDLVMLDLAEEGNYVAVRPSGTEPKIKLYVFTRVGAEQSQDLDAASAALSKRLEHLERDMRDYAKHNA